MKRHLLQLSGQTVIYGLSGAALSVVGLFTLPVFARALEPSEYGALELAVVAVSAFGILVDLGLSSASQRSYFDYRADQRRERGRVLLTALLVSLASALLLAGLGIAFAEEIAERVLDDPDYDTLVMISFLALPAGLLAQFGREVMRLTVRPWHYVVSSLLTAVAGAAIGIVAVTAYDAGPTGVQLGAVLGAAAAAIYGALIVHRDVGPGFSLADLRVMLRYGLPLVPTGAALWGVSLLDRIILSALEDLTEVGLYSVANRIASALMLLVIAFQTAYVPFFLSMHADDPAAERALRARVLTYLALALLMPALALGLFAEEAIAIVAPGYDEAAPAAAVLLIGIALHGLGGIGLAGISIARATGRIAIHTGIALVFNVGLCFALIPSLGQLGAAIATTAAYALLSALYFRSSQLLDPAPFEWRRLAAILVVVAGALPVAWIPFPSEGVAVAVKLAALAAATAALWPLGVIGPMERDFMRSLVPRR